VNRGPLVSVVTPVYNGEEHLAECIESVLSQTYSNWDYAIVNNCSTDRTLEIAVSYAAKDSRIRVHSNSNFAPIIENHNIALRQISPESKYCKVLFADDWLFSTCIEKMVELAEAYPSVGLVNAYSQAGDRIRWQGLPYPLCCIPGRQICRQRLLGGPYFLGTASSLLFRSDIVRQRPAFFSDWHIHADYTAFLDVLGTSDYGFVHEILTFCRPREESNTSFATDYNTLQLAEIAGLQKYGPVYLTSSELDKRMRSEMRRYYRFLAKSALRFRGMQFWKHHRDWHKALALRLDPARLLGHVFLRIAESLLRPVDVWSNIQTWWFQRGRTGAQPPAPGYEQISSEKALLK
jgi:glycosyltransferase involved in cell wall biosynthesis